MKLRLHLPIGLDMVRKGANLSVQDLIRKTSAQHQEDLRLDSKLVDQFPNGLPEIEEERLLDYVPLQYGTIRDFTDLENAKEFARQEIRRQYTAYTESEQRKRAKLAEQRKAFSEFMQRAKSMKDSPKPQDE